MRLTSSSLAGSGRPPTYLHLSRPWAAAAILGAMGGIFLLDRSTADTPVQHLYYLPIILAALQFGVAGGVATSLSAVVLYHLANDSLFPNPSRSPGAENRCASRVRRSTSEPARAHQQAEHQRRKRDAERRYEGRDRRGRPHAHAQERERRREAQRALRHGNGQQRGRREREQRCNPLPAPAAPRRPPTPRPGPATLSAHTRSAA